MADSNAAASSSSSTSSSSSLEAVVNALNVLYTNPDKDAKEKANAWLADFQKSVSPSVRPSQSRKTITDGPRGRSRHGRLRR